MNPVLQKYEVKAIWEAHKYSNIKADLDKAYTEIFKRGATYYRGNSCQNGNTTRI